MLITLADWLRIQSRLTTATLLIILWSAVLFGNVFLILFVEGLIFFSFASAFSFGNKEFPLFFQKETIPSFFSSRLIEKNTGQHFFPPSFISPFPDGSDFQN